LRRTIAEINGADAEDVVLTIGCVHALFLVAFTLCNPGDDVVLATPVFPPARDVAAAAGANVREVRLTFDERYALDVSRIADALTEKTKLVSLATPQNPSGVATGLSTLQRVLDVMRERCPDAYLLVDETYREAAFGDNPVAPSALSLGNRVISAASLSKCHGAPGVRLGWAIVRDRRVAEQLLLAKFNTVISNSPVEEFLALRILRARESIMNERRTFLAACVARTEAWVRENQFAIEWVRPDAGALCCVRLKAGVFDDAAVTQFYELLRTAGVLVSRGSWFGESDRVFRLGFAHLPLEQLDAAYRALSGVLVQIAGKTI
jgi:aspartate/methionine/tyrosine aminotransferase